MLRSKRTLPLWKTSILLMVIILTGFGAFFIARTNDPLIDYRGTLIRKSALGEYTENEVYCQGLAPFSFGPTFSCFDSQQELDAFAASRR